jgi:hypothetical protein
LNEGTCLFENGQEITTAILFPVKNNAVDAVCALLPHVMGKSKNLALLWKVLLALSCESWGWVAQVTLDLILSNR